MSTWMDVSANNFKRSYIHGFVDVSGPVTVRNNEKLDLLDSSGTSKFSITSAAINVIDPANSAQSFATNKLAHLKNLSGDVQSNIDALEANTQHFTSDTTKTTSAKDINLASGKKLVGNVTGNADTATILANPRLIGGVGFNGSADINLPGVNTSGTQNTSGSAATVSNGSQPTISTLTGLTSIGTNGETVTNSGSETVAQNLTVNGTTTVSNLVINGTTTGIINVDSAAKITTDRLIGGVAFNGTADINLPGVNVTGNQNTTGTAVSVTNSSQPVITTLAGVTSVGAASQTTNVVGILTVGQGATITGGATINGGLTVNGTTTTVNATNLEVTDNLIEVGKGTSGEPINDSGILINRGIQSNGFIGFDESADKFVLGLTGSSATATGNLNISTGTVLANIEGTLQGAVGGTTPYSGSFTALSATSLNATSSITVPTLTATNAKFVTNLGINLGAANPSESLEVSGNIKANGNLILGGTTFTAADLTSAQSPFTLSGSNISFTSGLITVGALTAGALTATSGSLSSNLTVGGTITSTGTVNGNLIGNVTGDVTGDLTNGDVTIVAGKTLSVADGTLTMSVNQKRDIIQGSEQDVDFGEYDVRAKTLTSDSLGTGRVVFTGLNGVLLDKTGFSFANSTDTLTVPKIAAFEAAGNINMGSNSILNASSIDNTPIGASTANTGSFTTLATSGASTLAGAVSVTNATQSTSSTSGALKTTGGLGVAKSVFIGDSASVTNNLTVGGNATVTGNLTVNGTTTTINTTNMDVTDSLIGVSKGTSGTPANDAGLLIDRGSSTNAFIGMDESADKFVMGLTTADTNATGDLTITPGILVVSELEGTIKTASQNDVTTMTGLSTIGSSGSNATHAGSLTVSQGVTSSSLHLTGSSLTIEGATENAFETTLAVTDPTADRTITFPDTTGTVLTTGDTGSVTNDMLAGSIASGKLSGGITNAQLAGSIANNKLANSSITIAGAATSLGGAVTTANILDSIGAGGINANKLASGIVNAQITDSTIANAKLANSTVTIGSQAISLGATLSATNLAAELPAGSITNAQLTGSVANNKLANSSITIAGAATALGGAITADTILGQITAGTITNAQLAGSIDLTSKVTGALPIASGGTGATSVSAAATALGLGTSNSPTFTNVTSSSEPTNASHLATKSYVDGVAEGLDVKASVRVATTANITLENTQNIDSIGLLSGDRVLVKNQTTSAQNGVYLVVDGGSWTRTDDFNASSEIKGAFCFVEEGGQQGQGFVCINTGTTNIGSDAITFTQFTSAASTIVGGNGLNKTGTTLSVDPKANGGLVIESEKLALDVGASAITGTLGAASGGTGLASYTVGDIVYATGATTLSKLAKGADNRVLTVNDSGTLGYGQITNDMLLGGITDNKFSQLSTTDKVAGSAVQLTSSGSAIENSSGLRLKSATAGAGLSMDAAQVLSVDADQSAVITTIGTMTGLNMGQNSTVKFEGATVNDFETTLTVTDPTADRTITLPNITGTVITTGDTGTVTSDMLTGSIHQSKLNGGILDAQLVTISTTDKVSGSAVQLSGTSALENSTGLRLKSAIGGTGLTLTDQVLAVDAAQAQITSVGTLTSLAVDNVAIDGTTIGHSADTDLITLADGSVTFTGTTVIPTADINGGAIDGTAIGAASTSTGAFTTLAASSTLGVTGVTTLSNSTQSTNTTTGGLIVSGGAGIAKNANVGGDLSVSGNAVVTGNLTVNGTTTTVNTTNTVVSDALLELGNGTTGSAANDAGIVIERGDDANVFMGWDESADKFRLATTTATGSSTGDMTFSGTATLVSNLEGNVTGNVTGDVNVSGGTLTTTTAQNLAVMQGAAANVDIGAFNMRAASVTADGLTAGQVVYTGTDGLLSAESGFAYNDSTNTLSAPNLTASGTVTVGTLTNTGTLTLPTSTDTLVGRATADTLTNKTLTTPVISTISNTGTLTLPTSTDTLVGRDTTDTLTSKTLTAPVIATITNNSNTLTLPTTADTIVGRDTTDTLTNKTLTAPKFGSAGVISDVNGNELVKFPGTVASAINEVTISNASTGNLPSISATGDDTHVSLTLSAKGSGSVVIPKVDINGGTIDGAIIATSDVTVGAGKSLNVSGGSLTTSAAQNLAIMQGAAANVDIGAHDFRAANLTADGLTAGRILYTGTDGLLSGVGGLEYNHGATTLTAPNVTVSGNLIVNGTTTTVSTANTVVSDKLMELGNGTSGNPTADAGIIIERGSDDNVFMGWDEAANKFTMGSSTAATGSSTDVVDGSFTAGTLVLGRLESTSLSLGGTTLTSTVTELNVMDAGTTQSTVTLADGDGVVINDADDTMTQCLVSDFGTYIAGATLTLSNKTLDSGTMTGSFAGTPTFSGASVSFTGAANINNGIELKESGANNAAQMKFYESTTHSHTHYAQLTMDDGLAANYVIKLPHETGTILTSASTSIANANIAGAAAIADSKLATISTPDKVSGTAVQLAGTSAIENNTGLQLKSATAGAGLTLTNQVFSVDADQSSQITQVGTLTALTVDNVAIDGSTIGHTSDADLITLANGSVTFTGSTVIPTADINGGAIDGTAIGAASASTAAFTTLAASGATTITNATSSTNKNTGALIVTGGVGIVENLNVGGSATVDTNLTVTGNLTVNGTTTTVSTTNMTVEDRLLELATGTTGTPTTDAGIVIERGDSSNLFMGWDHSSTAFAMGTTTSTGAESGALSITTGTLKANIEGTVGAANAAAGSFTTLSASSSLTLGGTAITATGTELNLMDAGTTQATVTLADGDGVVINDADSTMKQCLVSDFGTYIAGKTLTLTDKTLTEPKFANAGFIADANGNEMLEFNTTASAVNYFGLTNSATGSGLLLEGKGTDANLDFELKAKGTGLVKLTTNSSRGITFDFDGTTADKTTTLIANSSDNRSITLPDATTTVVGRDTADTLTNKVIASFTGGNSNAITVPTSAGTIALTNQLHDSVTLANTDYLSLSGQVITGGTVPVASGGTNLTSYTAGDIIYASGATALSKLAKGSNNTILQVTDSGTLQYGTVTNSMLAGSIANAKLSNSAVIIAGTAVSLGSSISANVIASQITSGTITNDQLAGSIDLTTKVTGALPIANGGTGATTASAAATALGLGTGDSPTFTNATSSSAPTANNHLATKSYVDSAIEGLVVKDSVRVATTANGTLASAFANGETIDGLTLATNDRILLKNQTTGSENGIYTVNASGAPTRATDFSANDEVKGAFCFIEEGTANADKGFVCTTNGSITLGTTSLAFTQFSGSATGGSTAGPGLTKTGSEFSINAAQTGITSVGTLSALTVDNVAIDGSTIGHTSDVDLITFADGSVTFTGSTVIPTADINGGAIDGTTIGAASASTGSFTSLSATSISIGGISLTSTATELNIMDASQTTPGTVTLADSDGFVMQDADQNTMKQCLASDIKTYAQSGIVATSALDAGSITSGFGAIDNGTSNITTGGLLKIDVDGTAVGAAGSLTLGAAADAGLYVSSNNLVIENATSDKDIIFRVNDGGSATTVATVDGDVALFNFVAGKLAIDGTAVSATAAELNIMDGFATTQATVTLAGTDGIVMNDAGTMKQCLVSDITTYVASTLTSASSLTTVGALASGSIAAGFGAIDNGTSNITTGGILSVDVDTAVTPAANVTGIGAAGSLTFGEGADAGLYVASDNLYIENKTTDKDIIFRVSDNGSYTTVATVDGDVGLFKVEAGKLAIGATTIGATGVELNMLDASATSAGTTTVVDGHGILMNQDGTTTLTTVQTLAAYLDDEITAMPNLVTTAATTVGALASGTIASGFGTISTANTITTTAAITGGSLITGSGSANGEVKSNGDYDLVLKTGNSTTGSITITDGADGAITLDPNGSGSVVVSGNLTVSGLTTTVNSTNTLVADRLLELANGTTGNPTADSGIIIERGDDPNVFMGWDESENKFTMGTSTSATGASITVGDFTAGTLVVGTLEGTVGTADQGSITSVGTLTELTVNGNVSVSNANNNLDIASHNGTYGLALAGTIVSSSAAELNKLTGVTATSNELNYLDITTLGTSENSKAVTATASGHITLGTTGGNQIIDIASHDLVDGGLKLAGTLVTSSAAELNLLDTATAGTVQTSKAVIYSANGDVKGTTLTSTGNVTVGHDLTLNADAAVLSIGSTGAVTLTHSDSILTVNASKKLAFGDAGDYIMGDGTDLSVISSGAATITAAAASTWSTSAGLLTLNGAGGLTLGTAANTAITIDPNGSGNLTLGSSDNTTTSLNGAALNIDAAGALGINSAGGVISIGNNAVAQPINVGTGAAARTITIGNNTGATALQLTSGTGSITMTGDVVVADGTNDFDIASHDAGTNGLKLGGTLVTSTAAELNTIAGSKTQKFVYAAPNGADGAAVFRALVASDIPTLNQSTTGNAATASVATKATVTASTTNAAYPVVFNNDDALLDATALTYNPSTTTLSANTLSATSINIGETSLTSTATELNIVDGDTSATATTVVAADRVVLNDGGTMVQAAVTDLDTFFSATTKTLTNKTLDAVVLGTPASGDLTNCTFPTLNQNTTGTAVTVTAAAQAAITSVGSLTGLTMADAGNIAVNATTGTKIGTATTQKLGFFNATPVVQQSNIADASSAQGEAAASAPTQAEFNGLRTDVQNLTTKLNAILSALEALGLLANA